MPHAKPLVALRFGAAYLAVISWAALADLVEPCYESGVAFLPNGSTSFGVPNGLYVHRASICQSTCSNMWFCDRFSFKPSNGACYLVGTPWEEQNLSGFTSGPKRCPTASTSAPANTTAMPTSTLEPATSPEPASNETNTTVPDVDNQDTQGGGWKYPWLWGILALAALVFGGLLLMSVFGHKDEKKKKKKKQSRGSRLSAPSAEQSQETSPTPTEEQPMLASVPPSPQQDPRANVGSFVAAPPVQYAQQYPQYMQQYPQYPQYQMGQP